MRFFKTHHFSAYCTKTTPSPKKSFHLNLLHSKIHGNNVVSGAVKLNRDSIDPLFVSVSPTPLPTETREDLRIEL